MMDCSMSDQRLSNSLSQQLTREGFAVTNFIYNQKELDEVAEILQGYKDKNPGMNRSLYAIRDLFHKLPDLKELLFNHKLKAILCTIDAKLFLCKAMFFDKPAQSNWYVTWHQDITINVKEKIETKGYTGWTRKGAVYGVSPPEEVLHNIVTLRIHLDDTNQENGALKVLPGSHQKKFTDLEIKSQTETGITVTCEVKAGGIQFMKPLLLHASSKTTNGKGRRVIHLEFSSADLPNGLLWAEKWSWLPDTGVESSARY